MKILILLLLCVNLQAQIVKNINSKPSPIENYVYGFQLIMAFPIVNEVDKCLFDKYIIAGENNYNKYVNQRTLFVGAYILTSFGTYVAIKHIRKHIEANNHQKKYRKKFCR